MYSGQHVANESSQEYKKRHDKAFVLFYEVYDEEKRKNGRKKRKN